MDSAISSLMSTPADLVDLQAAVIERARAGDARAFERLYREHVGRVYALCLRMTRDADVATDCTQEAFISAWRALPRFQSRSSFATWLHRIAVNAVLARRRQPSVSREQSLDAMDDAEPGEVTFDSPVEEAELEAAIASLPQGARDVLVLCGVYGYEHREAAEMLGIAVGTCKAQLHRARGLLRERL
ncbi:MAG TPA: sigma-70 family RNA polymerase sigma factor, partial [Steroidobacteraceae bacterium]|nr:sigma-70 family RNA polymerase sigma factor [Steroidobacteraceae bacterium]